jgi:hypothetical protein
METRSRGHFSPCLFVLRPVHDLVYVQTVGSPPFLCTMLECAETGAYECQDVVNVLVIGDLRCMDSRSCDSCIRTWDCCNCSQLCVCGSRRSDN